jgi:hypothetical protein
VLVFAKESGMRVGPDGQTPTYFTAGEAWEGSSPFVQQNKDLFDVTPPQVRGRTGTEAAPPRIERATARPGEKRG